MRARKALPALLGVALLVALLGLWRLGALLPEPERDASWRTLQLTSAARVRKQEIHDPLRPCLIVSRQEQATLLTALAMAGAELGDVHFASPLDVSCDGMITSLRKRSSCLPVAPGDEGYVTWGDLVGGGRRARLTSAENHSLRSRASAENHSLHSHTLAGALPDMATMLRLAARALAAGQASAEAVRFRLLFAARKSTALVLSRRALCAGAAGTRQAFWARALEHLLSRPRQGGELEYYHLFAHHSSAPDAQAEPDCNAWQLARELEDWLSAHRPGGEVRAAVWGGLESAHLAERYVAYVTQMDDAVFSLHADDWRDGDAAYALLAAALAGPRHVVLDTTAGSELIDALRSQAVAATGVHLYGISEAGLVTDAPALDLAAVSCGFGQPRRQPFTGRVIDAFLYNGEADVAEARLYELDAVVDLFVVSEWNYTLTGAPKTRSFMRLVHQRLARFAHKIVYDDGSSINRQLCMWQRTNGSDHMSFGKNHEHRYACEEAQRDSLESAIPGGLRDSDYIMLTDADEVVSRHWLAALRVCEFPLNVSVMFRVRTLQYSLHWPTRGHTHAVSAFPGILVRQLALPFHMLHKDFAGTSHCITFYTSGEFSTRAHGWHLSYFMTPAAIALKVASFSEHEYNQPPFNDVAHIRDCAYAGADFLQRDVMKMAYSPALGVLDLANGLPAGPWFALANRELRPSFFAYDLTQRTAFVHPSWRNVVPSEVTVHRHVSVLRICLFLLAAELVTVLLRLAYVFSPVWPPLRAATVWRLSRCIWFVQMTGVLSHSALLPLPRVLQGGLEAISPAIAPFVRQQFWTGPLHSQVASTTWFERYTLTVATPLVFTVACICMNWGFSLLVGPAARCLLGGDASEALAFLCQPYPARALARHLLVIFCAWASLPLASAALEIFVCRLPDVPSLASMRALLARYQMPDSVYNMASYYAIFTAPSVQCFSLDYWSTVRWAGLAGLVAFVLAPPLALFVDAVQRAGRAEAGALWDGWLAGPADNSDGERLYV